MKIKDFLREDSEYSMIRLAVLLIVVVALIIALVQVAVNANHKFDYIAVNSLLGLALGSKVFQKFKENKN